MSSETGTTTFNIEPEFSFEDSLQPSKRRPEYWDRLGSSKFRTEEQQNESRSIIQGLLYNCSPSSIIAFTDGSCQPNPGPCGAGSCIFMPYPGLQIYGGPGSLTHDFKIWPITFQGSGPSGPILFSCEKITL